MGIYTGMLKSLLSAEASLQKLEEVMKALGYKKQTAVTFTTSFEDYAERYDPSDATYWYRINPESEVAICPRKGDVEARYFSIDVREEIGQNSIDKIQELL